MKLHAKENGDKNWLNVDKLNKIVIIFGNLINVCSKRLRSSSKML